MIHGPIQAIVALGPKYVTWPNETRRLLISNVMKTKGFEGCVGSLDDLKIMISYPPGDESFLNSQSGTYSINAQIVCDCSNRITAFFSGWPGDDALKPFEAAAPSAVVIRLNGWLREISGTRYRRRHLKAPLPAAESIVIVALIPRG